MYLASKYEDIIPLNSFVAYEKISHKGVSQTEILRLEGEFLKQLEFSLEFITAYDFHMYFLEDIKMKLGSLNEEQHLLMKKLGELSLLLIRMSIQNIDYQKFSPSLLTSSAIYAAIGLLRSHKVYVNDKFFITLTK